jgi:hypothetical protein
MNRKRKPTYDLEAFKAASSDPGRLAITGNALKKCRCPRIWKAGDH